ncbi:MAG: phytoene desaturase family protein [Puniceicoccales bacterium]
MKPKGKALVVGAGLGGLSAAIHLALDGHQVTLLEKNEQPGGKANYRHWNGYHFDTGPSLVTMPFVLRELFERAGRKLEDYLELTRVTPACRYFFSDGCRFEAPGNLEGMRAAIAETFPGEEVGFDKFIKNGKRLWEVSGPAFLFNPMELSTLFKINPLKGLAGLSALRPETLLASLQRHFKDPHLIQLFSRYATYNGSDPARTPATFNVISYVEMAFGSWHLQGGIYTLVKALVRLAEELGVEIRCQCPVQALTFASGGKSVSGVELGKGERLSSERVVINADAVTALSGPLMAQHPKAAQWKQAWSAKEVSGSGYVMLLAIEKNFPELACHNIFFCEEYAREFREIFDQAKPLGDPTIYISAPCKVDPSQAPGNGEAWFVLVNAPSLDRCADWPESYPNFLLKRLQALVPGFTPDSIRWQQNLGPTFLRDTYGAWQGSIYGPSSNSTASAFFRVRNRSSVRGLAFAGGSAHPGGGIPLVLTSGRLAAQAL